MNDELFTLFGALFIFFADLVGLFVELVQFFLKLLVIGYKSRKECIGRSLIFSVQSFQFNTNGFGRIIRAAGSDECEKTKKYGNDSFSDFNYHFYFENPFLISEIISEKC